MQIHSKKRGRRWSGTVVLGAAMAGVGLSSRGFGQTVATWVNPVDGFWVDSDRWSTGSFYPNNGTPTLADHYEVTIGASGAPYTVTLTNKVSIDRVAVSSSDATLRLAGGELTTPSINLNGGQLLINSGAINGSTIAISGTGKALANASGALNAVTLQGMLQLAPTGAGQLVIKNGLTLANGTISIVKTDNGSSVATLLFQGTQTIAGHGAIVLEGLTDDHVRVESGTLTLGPSAIIRSGSHIGLGHGSIDINNASGYMINQGLISSQTRGNAIHLVATNFGTGLTNLGTLEAINGGVLDMNCLTGDVGHVHIANGGWLLIDGQSFNINLPITVGAGNSLGFGIGSWTNSSTIDVTGGTLSLFKSPTALGSVILSNGTVHLTGAFTPAQVSALPLTSSTVVSVGATFNNSNNNIVMDGPQGSWRLSGGTISGGSISASGAGPFTLVEGIGGTLSGVSVNTYISVKNGSLTLAGTNSSGRIITSDSLLRLTGSAPTLGSIEMTGGTLAIRSRNFLLSDLSSIQRSGTLFLFESGNGTNSGANFSISSSIGGLKMLGGTIFGGTISSTDGSAIEVSAGPSVTQPTGFTSGAGTFDGVLLQAPLHLNMVTPNGIWGRFRTRGAWRNESTITLDAGTLDLGGSFTVGDIGKIDNRGGVVALTTSLDNTAGTLDLSKTGTLNLSGGTIVGGTIVGDSSNGIKIRGEGFGSVANGALDAVTLAAPLNLDVFSNLTIKNGITLNNSVITGMVGVGTIGSLQTQSISGAGTILVGNGKTLWADTGTTTIGSGITVQGTGLVDSVGSVATGAGGTVNLLGRMLADGSGVTLTISGNFLNQGILQTKNGASLTLANTPLNYSADTLTSGTWCIGANSTMSFASSTIITNNANVILDGPASTFTAINQLRTNLGRFTITNGRNFNTVGSLTNSGSITVGPQSTLTVLSQLNNSGGLINMNNKLIVDYAGASPLDDLVSQIGTNIISSLAQSDPNLAIGSMNNGDVVLLQLTRNGDTNLDGQVDYTDLNTLSQHFSDSIVPLHWVDGDFNYDGSINITDLYALGYNYQDPQHPFTESLEQLGLPIIEVPEPMSLALLTFTAAWSLFDRAHNRLQRPRRRRRTGISEV